MSSSLESLAVKSSRVSSHSAKFESSRESPKKVTRVRLESLPVTRVNNSALHWFHLLLFSFNSFGDIPSAPDNLLSL